MSDNDIRWKQRLENYSKAYFQLKEAFELYENTQLPIIKAGIIQRFEFTHELSWKLLKDYLIWQGYQNINGSRDAVKTSFNIGLISNGKIWIEMIRSRSNTVHTYDKNILETEYTKIKDLYLPLFEELFNQMTNILNSK